MRYLTAIQAAERLNRSDKTIRRWIEAGKLTAHHVAKNQLAIPESEIEAIARELQQYEQEPAIDIRELASRVETLEQEVRELQASLSLMQGLSFAKPRRAAVESSDDATRTRRPREAIAPGDLPSGSLLASDFAEMHGVNQRTFRDHIVKGIKGDQVAAIERGKPGRAHLGEIERWLTPDQQQQAMQFWQRHGVNFKRPEPTE